MSSAVATPPAAAAPAGDPFANWPNVRGRLGSDSSNRVTSLVGMPWQRRLAKAALLVPEVRKWEAKYLNASDAELAQASKTLRGRARGGEPLDKLLTEAFGLVCVASWRAVGMRPFDVQVAGGVILHHGGLAELATGEGKTLTAMLPTFLDALAGKGVHVTTVNDYLAKRDADEVTGPVYSSCSGFERRGVAAKNRKMQRPRRCLQAGHHLRDCVRVRVRLPARPAHAPDDARRRADRQAARSGRSWTLDASLKSRWTRASSAGHYYAVVDEADSDLHRRGPHPADYLGSPTPHRRPRKKPVVYHWADERRGQACSKGQEHFTVVDRQKATRST